MITIPPFQQTSPSDTARAWEGGFGEGTAAFSEGQRIKQNHAELQQRQEALDLDKQRFMVDAAASKQRMQLEAQAAARSSQAFMGYQQAVSTGMDPYKALMIYGPAMSGGRLTGFSPVFNQAIKSGAGSPGGGAAAPASSIPGAAPRATAAPPANVEATPIYEPGSDNVLGYGYGKSIHWNTTPKSTGKMSDVDKQNLAAINKELTDIHTKVQKGFMGEQEAIKARIRTDQLNKQRQDIIDKYSDTGTGGNAAAPPGIDFLPPVGQPGAVTRSASAPVPAGAPAGNVDDPLEIWKK